MAVSAIAGVQVGIYVQEVIAEALGPAGTSFYVSMAFILVLPIVSYFLIRDVIRSKRGGLQDTTSELALKAQSLHVPPMVRFKVAESTISVWILVPLGFATGFLAATIAVGGFIGVPSMMYIVGAPSFVASATELVIAFVMGMAGTFRWGLLGMVDIRMTLLILFGSLFGVQLGAIGTSYVKPYVIKVVMATVMLLVTLSRVMAIVPYLGELGWISLDRGMIPIFQHISFAIICLSVITAGVFIITPMVRKRLALKREGRLAETTEAQPARSKILPTLLLFGAVSLTSYVLIFMAQDWGTGWLARGTMTSAITIIVIAIYFSLVHGAFANRVFQWFRIGSLIK
jgi:uncharacterized membrane protein YfcA